MSRRLLDETIAQRLRDGCGRVRTAELLMQARDVLLHRARADVEPRPDPRRAEPVGEQREHLPLARRQVERALAVPRADLAQELLVEVRRDHRLPADRGGTCFGWEACDDVTGEIEDTVDNVSLEEAGGLFVSYAATAGFCVLATGSTVTPGGQAATLAAGAACAASLAGSYYGTVSALESEG